MLQTGPGGELSPAWMKRVTGEPLSVGLGYSPDRLEARSGASYSLRYRPVRLVA